MCDAAVFPNMKRSVGALTTADEIWKACRKVWNEITPETCAAMDQRVWRNTKQVQRLKGGGTSTTNPRFETALRAALLAFFFFANEGIFIALILETATLRKAA